jgi:hypothetical protein
LAENRGVILFQCHRALFRMGSRGGTVPVSTNQDLVKRPGFASVMNVIDPTGISRSGICTLRPN